MKTVRSFLTGAAVIVLVMTLLVAITPGGRAWAAQSADQILMSLKFIKGNASSQGGVQAQGLYVLQTGQLSTLSAAVASATDAQVVAAPSAGSTYIRAIVVDKTAGATGVTTIEYGTGANCATGKTVIVTFTDLPVGVTPLGILAPATKAVCLVTEGASTEARILYN